MENKKFETLMKNVKNICSRDLIYYHKVDLYNVSFAMTTEQLKNFADLLVSKGVAYREYGNVFINGIKECIL